MGDNPNSYKITLDAGLRAATLPAILTLKNWETEGKIEIFEADRAKEAKPVYGWPGAAPVRIAAKPWARRGRPGSQKSWESPSMFGQVSSVLFPFRDSHKLDMSQINNVVHLIRHQSLGHKIFITCNTRDFIEQGKRERLKAGFKVTVMTPDEAVEMLCVTEKWGPVLEETRARRPK